MKYELRWISTDGKSGRWTGPFATRQEAEEHAALRQMANGLSYTVEEVPDAPEPGSTAAHHVEILRERVKELEEELARAKPSLATAPSVPVGASEAPGEGGDSDRRRLAVLNDWIRGGHRAFGCQNGIVVALDGLCLRPVVEAPTLAALANKLAEKETKP